jgi:hypothetical protein
MGIRGHYFRHIGYPEGWGLRRHQEISPETIIPNPIPSKPSSIGESEGVPIFQFQVQPASEVEVLCPSAGVLQALSNLLTTDGYYSFQLVSFRTPSSCSEVVGYSHTHKLSYFPIITRKVWTVHCVYWCLKVNPSFLCSFCFLFITHLNICKKLWE